MILIWWLQKIGIMLLLFGQVYLLVCYGKLIVVHIWVLRNNNLSIIIILVHKLIITYILVVESMQLIVLIVMGYLQLLKLYHLHRYQILFMVLSNNNSISTTLLIIGIILQVKKEFII